jgi:transcriptional regulator of aroF, aroG, tyrA and aromatic amino acid transport
MPQQSTGNSKQATSQDTIKIKTNFRDRIGIVTDVSTVITQFGLNILHMEVIKDGDFTDVYIEIENADAIHDKDTFIEHFRAIKDFHRIERIENLPHEETTNRFETVLDNISDGVVSIDKEGKVTTINKVASRAFNKNPNQIIGKNLTSIDLPEYPLLKCLKGETIINAKQNLITEDGRYQYISNCKPIYDNLGQIIGAVEIAKDMREIKKLARTLSEESKICFSDIIGCNSSIKEAIAFAEKIASTDISISIHGGSGTGKELFAKAIHTSSNRDGPFVPINCAALPENLLESELFGYEAGAFTGGKKGGNPGLFEIAGNGTVFLDEIAEMPLMSQAKMLRLIQEKAVRRIGGAKEIPIKARIITATNKNLEQLVQEKKFRQDLYYRISVLPIHIPPLSQRKEDIPILVEHFLFLLADRLGKTVPRLSHLCMDKLNRHDWPGNVRELKNVIERAAILCEGDSIEPNRILFSYELNHLANTAGQRSDNSVAPLKSQVVELEKKIITQTIAIKKTIRQSAKVLDISHTALLKKMRKYGMRV